MNGIQGSLHAKLKVILVIILALLAIVGLGMFAVRDSIPLPVGGEIETGAVDPLGGLIPERIIIPRINVSASVVPVGVDAQGNMAVPENLEEVGWYEPGFKPGQSGGAVFAGHVNSRFGLPTVFKDLEQLEVGDTFTLIAETNEELTFSVVAIHTYDFRNAPLEEIYGPQDVPTVNLITCDDELWLGAEGTYKDRLVVTAVLASPEDQN